MKRFIWIGLVFICGFLFSCNKDVKLNVEDFKLTLHIDEVVNINASVNVRNYTIEYSVQGSSVSVDENGVLKAIEVGESVLTIRIKEISSSDQTFNIVVLNDTASIKYVNIFELMYLHQTYEVTYILEGEGSIKLESSDPSIIEVNGLTINALSIGYASISVIIQHSLEDALVFDCEVIACDTFEVDFLDELVVGYEYSFNVVTSSSKVVKVSVSDTSLAKISVDNKNIKLELLKTGNVTISVWLENQEIMKYTANLRIIPENFNLVNITNIGVGESLYIEKLTNFVQKICFESNNEDILIAYELDSDIYIKGVSEGVATIKFWLIGQIEEFIVMNIIVSYDEFNCSELDRVLVNKFLYISFSINHVTVSYDRFIVQIEDETIASYNEGSIKGLIVGTTKVYIYLYGQEINKMEYSLNVVSLSINGPNTIIEGRNATYSLIDNNGISYKADSFDIDKKAYASVSNTGRVSGLIPGDVVLSIYYDGGDMLTKMITIEKAMPTNLNILNTFNSINLFNTITPIIRIEPSNASQLYVIESSDLRVIQIDKDNNIYAYGTGIALVTFRCVDDPNIFSQAEITVNITQNIMEEIVRMMRVEKPIANRVTTFGATEIVQTVLGSVYNYLFDDLNLTIDYRPIVTNEWTGKSISDLNSLLGNTFIVPRGGNSNANNINGYSPGSWGAINYGKSVVYDNVKDLILKQIQNSMVGTNYLTRSGILKDEIKYITYHDTGNNTTNAGALSHNNYIKGNTERGRSWHYSVDSNSVYLHIPVNEIAWHGDNYESYVESIGIETCIDNGNDLYATWLRSAKLMANICIEYGLLVETAILQHYEVMKVFEMDIYGSILWDAPKNCPQTLRRSNLYDMAIQLIKYEYLVQREILAKGFKLELTSAPTEYVNSKGRIVKVAPTTISYNPTVVLKNSSGAIVYTYGGAVILPTESDLVTIPPNPANW